MTMTRRDFTALAIAIDEAACTYPDAYAALLQVAKDMAVHCAMTNRAFKRQKFMDTCFIDFEKGSHHAH